MRIKIKFVFLGILLLTFALLSYGIYIKKSHKEMIKSSIMEIPVMSFYDLDGNQWTHELLAKNRHVIFFYFNSGCDFCQYEAESVRNRIEEFHKAELIFISSEEAEDISRFANAYKLNGFENVQFLQDPLLSFSQIFGFNVVPTTLVYNRDNRLVKSFKGGCKD